MRYENYLCQVKIDFSSMIAWVSHGNYLLKRIGVWYQPESLKTVATLVPDYLEHKHIKTEGLCASFTNQKSALIFNSEL
jgi:hypothetical protein